MVFAEAENARKSPIVKAIQTVSPAVVNISSEYEIYEQSNPFSNFEIGPGFDSFFRDFFDHRFDQKYKRSSLGSGVIIDGKRGFILTNTHVINRAGTITVVLKDGGEYKAKVVGADTDSDLAVLKISSSETLPSIEMGSSDDIMIGETVIAIGNPFGFSNTVTTGVISAVNRSIKTEERIFHDFIQTDASINPGNSGGPLLNINGELIGINTAIYAKAQGIGFAIPIDKAKRIVFDLIRYGEVLDVWVGLIIQNLELKLAGYLKVPGNKGVMIKTVELNSPAEKAGLTSGDIILSIENRKINSYQDYYNSIDNYFSGDTINISLWKNNKKFNVSVILSVFPMDLAMALAYRLMGIKVKNFSSTHNNHYNNNKGVFIYDISKGSYLYSIGVRPGDIIHQIDDITINNIEIFKKTVIKYRKKNSLVLLLLRGNRGYYITVQL
jgi:Do/DeqQ family serine protease